MLARQLFRGACALVVLALASCTPSRTAQLNLPDPEVVAHVDLKKYAGTWYEIARLPNSFQKNCTASRALYSVIDSGKVGVVNECRKGSADGKLKSVEGSARVVDDQSRAKLKVTFFWPFSGDYWILDLAEDYSYAAVGTPSRDYLWILSRTPEMDDAIYRDVVARLADDGFDVARLIRDGS